MKEKGDEGGEGLQPLSVLKGVSVLLAAVEDEDGDDLSVHFYGHGEAGTKTCLHRLLKLGRLILLLGLKEGAPMAHDPTSGCPFQRDEIARAR